MKKVLILTVTAGNGHNACARAMKNKLEQSGDVEVKMVDILKSYSTELNVWVADGGYSLAVSRLPLLYNAFYKLYQSADPLKRYSCAPQSTVITTLDGLLKEILEFQPDVIYSTHFYGAIAITDLKLVYNLPCKCIVANLDYVNSPFWEAGVGVDYFAIPNEDFIDEFLDEGYEKEKLLPLGLPVDGRTLYPTEKSEARRKLGLKQDVFTILVTFGGGHWSGEYQIVKSTVNALKGRKAQIIAINGKNKKSFRKIKHIKTEDGISILNVGFTNDIPLYLSASDLAISKFGGTGLTEILNAEVPMLITENLPAQEQFNLEYLKKKGVVLSFKNQAELKDRLLDVLDNPEILQKLSAAAKPFKKDAIGDLAKIILDQPAANYEEILKENIDFEQVQKQVKLALKNADKKERKLKKR